MQMERVNLMIAERAVQATAWVRLARLQTRSHLPPGAGGVSNAAALPLLGLEPSAAALVVAPPPQATARIAKAIRRTSVFMIYSPQRSHILQARINQADQPYMQLVGRGLGKVPQEIALAGEVNFGVE